VSTLAIIANPHAQRNRLWPLAAEALRKAAPGAPILETPTWDDLRSAAKRLAADKPRVVAIAGGDGTVQHTVTALHEALGAQLPDLALLGGGAHDSLAGGLGGRGSAEDRLARIAQALVAGRPGRELIVEERDTLSVGGRLGFRLGAGLPQRFLEAAYTVAEPGPWASAAMVARALLSAAARGPFARALYAPLRVTVSADGEEWPRVPIFGIVCATVAEGGLGTRPFRRATEQPGAFQVLGLTGRPGQFIAELPRLVLGRPARRDRILDAVAERLDVHGAPFRWFLDGEMQPATDSLQVRVGPRVRLVRA
jgi:diacylglycerol kinase family enzyme